MFDKLEDLLHHYEELMNTLSEPDVANDPNRFRKLMKEQSDLQPIVDAYKEYKACKQTIEDSLAILDEESDEEYEEGETSEFYYETFELYPETRKDHLVLPIGKRYIGCAFDILLEDKYLFTATVGKRGYVKLHKNLDLTDEIIEGLDKGLRVVAKVRD